MKNLILLLFFIGIIPFYAEEDKEYKKIISLSEKLADNFEFDSCQTIIYKAIKLAPERPEAFQILAKIYLWFYLGSEHEDDYNRFINFSDSTLIKAEILLKENNSDEYFIYLLGNIYKYRAIAYSSQGNTLDAFLATKKAVSFYEDVVKIDPNFYSAYGGIGIFEYALSFVPEMFNWALQLSGLSSNPRNGFQNIEKASKFGKLDNPEYTFHLAKIYDEYFADYEKSLSIIKSLIKKYSGNILFRYQAAIGYIKSRKLDEALNELEILLNSDNQKFAQTNSFSNFLIGDIYFRKNDFREALIYYLKFLTTTNTIDYTGIASLRTAYCYYFLDNEKEFRRYAILAANGNHDIEDDRFANELSLIVLKNGIDKSFELLIKTENSFLSGNDQQTIDLIDSEYDTLASSDIKAQLLYFKSSALINLNRLKEAKAALNEISALDLKIAGWVKPLIQYNLANIFYKENNFDLAEEYLNTAEENNDFQKKNLIESYINGLKEELKNAG